MGPSAGFWQCQRGQELAAASVPLSEQEVDVSAKPWTHQEAAGRLWPADGDEISFNE